MSLLKPKMSKNKKKGMKTQLITKSKEIGFDKECTFSFEGNTEKLDPLVAERFRVLGFI
ncbi:MAG: hypothetical protein ACFFAE_06310 [Candidatus Hodarchaeota archaeon]